MNSTVDSSRLQHLQMLQDVISRMANNSFMINNTSDSFNMIEK